MGLDKNCSNFEEKVGFKEGYLIKVERSPYNESKIAMVVLATNQTLLSEAVDFIMHNKFSTDIGTEIKEVKEEKQQSLKENQSQETQVSNNSQSQRGEAKLSFFQRIINWFKRLFG